eukprot:Skav221625  [mRNA]  locus=scaffold3212:53499:54803:- [translate_table: standard]
MKNPYYTRSYRIEAKIEAAQELENTINANLQAAWWESALLGRYDPTRQELLVIQENLQETIGAHPGWSLLSESAETADAVAFQVIHVIHCNEAG